MASQAADAASDVADGAVDLGEDALAKLGDLKLGLGSAKNLTATVGDGAGKAAKAACEIGSDAEAFLAGGAAGMRAVMGDAAKWAAPAKGALYALNTKEVAALVKKATGVVRLARDARRACDASARSRQSFGLTLGTRAARAMHRFPRSTTLSSSRSLATSTR